MPLPATLGAGPFADHPRRGGHPHAAPDALGRSARIPTPPPTTRNSASWSAAARFDPNRVDQRIPLGAVEEWTVVNEHEDDHVFHIHTNPFQMVAINGERLAERDWRDTVVVPRKGSVTFRSRFLDFTGRFVLHCHMMNHEELGMMQVVEVYST